MSEDPDRPAVDLGKGTDDRRSTESRGGSAPDFDPYRFGRPDHPIPPEYAPPGYVPDAPSSPYAAPNTPRSPYAQSPGGPQQRGASQYPGAAESHRGPQPYGGPQQYGYHQPPPPAPYGGYPTPQQRSGGNGRAVAALVLGIVSIVMCWLTVFNVIFLVLGLVFGILGMSDAKVRNGVGRGMALAGLICTAVGFVVTAVYTVWAFNLADKCGGAGNSGDPGFSDCLRDHI